MPGNIKPRITELTTASAPRREQFSYWDGVICQEILNVDLDRRGKGAFNGTLKSCSVGSFSINQVRADEHVATLTSRGITRPPVHCFKFHIQNSSIAKVRQHGCENILMPGDAVLIDCLYPFQLEFPKAFDCYSIKIPRARLRPLLENPRVASISPITSRSPLGKAIRHYIHFLINVSERPLADTQMQIFLENLLELIAAETSTPPVERKDGSHGWQVNKLSRIKRYILNNLEDPELTPTTVARHFSISVSYLHKLFAKGQETFGHYLRGQRLEFAAMSLKDQTNDHQTITELAYQFGFNDLSHFWRLFRDRYGMTPRKFRNPVAHS